LLDGIDAEIRLEEAASTRLEPQQADEDGLAVSFQLSGEALLDAGVDIVVGPWAAKLGVDEAGVDAARAGLLDRDGPQPQAIRASVKAVQQGRQRKRNTTRRLAVHARCLVAAHRYLKPTALRVRAVV
jgi:hypothetical protein